MSVARRKDAAPYRPETVADALGARLRTRLSDGSFGPGETLSIRRIADAEGLSVIPARDALRGLVAEGALEFRDSRTIQVPRLTTETVDEVRFARTRIETELADRAFPALRAALADLRALDARMNRAIAARDVAGYMATNRALHFRIYEAAGAPILLALAETLWLRFGPSMRIVCDALDGRLPGQDHHDAALRALEAGDRAGFRDAIRADIEQGMTLILRHGTGPAEDATEDGKDHR